MVHEDSFNATLLAFELQWHGYKYHQFFHGMHICTIHAL